MTQNNESELVKSLEGINKQLERYNKIQLMDMESCLLSNIETLKYNITDPCISDRNIAFYKAKLANYYVQLEEVNQMKE